MVWLKIKQYFTLLRACLIAEKTELLFKAYINNNTFSYSIKNFIILI